MDSGAHTNHLDPDKPSLVSWPSMFYVENKISLGVQRGVCSNLLFAFAVRFRMGVSNERGTFACQGWAHLRG